MMTLKMQNTARTLVRQANAVLRAVTLRERAAVELADSADMMAFCDEVARLYWNDLAIFLATIRKAKSGDVDASVDLIEILPIIRKEFRLAA